MAKTISASVGFGGANRFADVQTVQDLLNQIGVAQGGPAPPLAVDGLVGPKTTGAIRKFQQAQFGWNDGRVDPNNKTITRLNQLTAGPAPPPPAAKFSFQEAKANNGFDAKASPPWQMVPAGGSKEVKLVNATGLTFTSTNTGVATVTQPDPFRIIVKGVVKGTAFIEAKNGSGTVVARLEVAVKTKKTVSTAFFYVSDNAGHKTARALGAEVVLVKAVNDIYLPQANIEFTVRSAKAQAYAQNFGRVVRFSKHLKGVAASQHEWDTVVAQRDPAADFNVFFVWEYEQDRTPLIDNTEAGTLRSEKSCLMEDKTGANAAEEVLAHEAGHLLGVGDTTDPDELMVGAGVSKRKLPKAHVNVMNP